MKTRSALIYRVSKIIKNEKIEVTIRLNEECKNGYEYFSITCSGYERSRKDRPFKESFGGCCHNEILRFFPEFEIFTKLHLDSFSGYPMHAIANGYYFLTNGFDKVKPEDKNFKNYFCDYFKCTPVQFDKIKVAYSKEHFAVLLLESGIIEGWKNLAKKGIETLENLTGEKFKSKYESDKREIHITNVELKDYEQKKKEGYYTAKAVKARKTAEAKEAKKQGLQTIKSEMLKKVAKAKQEYKVTRELARCGMEIKKSGNIKGAIYHSHTHEVNFNWNSYEYVSCETIDKIVSKINKEALKGLIISNNKKEVTTI